MKFTKSWLVLIVVAGVLAAIAIYLVVSRPEKADAPQSSVTNFQECLEAGNLVMESYPAQCRSSDGRIFTQDIGNELELSDEIRSDNPRPNQVVTSPLEISGAARGNWFFEASFPASLVDANGNELAVVPIAAEGDWMTTSFVPFRGTITFPTPTTSTGTLVLKRNNASGLPEHDRELRIPVAFANYSADALTKTTVKVFFGNSSLGAECEKVEAVTREVDSTPAIGRAALGELVKGVQATEQDKGYTTAINAGVRVDSLSIQQGVARVDFSEELGRGVAGSCRVAAIRAQITETLKQFPTVDEVVISVAGETDSVLQP